MTAQELRLLGLVRLFKGGASRVMKISMPWAPLLEANSITKSDGA